MPPPWYSAGLRFECTQCGDCCTGDPGYVWVSTAEVQALAAHLQISLADFARRFLRRVGSKVSLLEHANGDCVFFKGGCTVYPVRPVQCRTFPFWPENLNRAASWEEAAEKCPGMNQGRLYAPEEIARIRRGEANADAG